MRRLVVALMVFGTPACNAPVATPTAPSASLVEPPSAGASFCVPSVSWRVYTVPVPGASTPVTVWLESVTPAPGATVRGGDSYSLSSRHATPTGFTTFVQFLVGDDAGAPRSLLVLSGGGCGGSTFRSQLPPVLQSPRITVRIWLEPGTVPPGTPPSPPTRPPEFEASEPLGWVIIP